MASPKEQDFINAITKCEPTEFLKPSEELADSARKAVKALFDSVVKSVKEKSRPQYNGLDELHVDGFDPEQIWLQIDMLHSTSASILKKNISRIVKNADAEFFILPPDDEKTKAVKETTENSDSGLEVSEEESDGEEIEEAGTEGRTSENDTSGEENENEGDEEEVDDEDIEGNKGKLPFEDKFFSVKELEQFLEKAEDENDEEFSRLPELYESGEILDDDDEDEEEGEGEEEDDDENEVIFVNLKQNCKNK